MNNLNKVELQLTNNEFIMLSYLLGAKGLSGIEDSNQLLTMGENELRREWKSIKESLVAKRYMRENNRNSLDVDVAVYSLLSICTNSEQLFSIEIAEDSKSVLHRNYYINDDGIVEVKFGNDDTSNLFLQPMYGVPHLAERIETLIGDADNAQSVESAKSGTLSKQEYYSLMASINMKNYLKAKDILIESGLPPDIAEEAVNGFVNKQRFISFSEKDNRNNDDVTQTYMFYFTQKYCFNIQITYKDEETFKLNLVAVSTCKDFIKEVIHRRCKSFRFAIEEVGA